MQIKIIEGEETCFSRIQIYLHIVN